MLFTSAYFPLTSLILTGMAPSLKYIVIAPEIKQPARMVIAAKILIIVLLGISN